MIRRLNEKNRRLLEYFLQGDPDLLHEAVVAATPSVPAIGRIHEILANELTRNGLDEHLEPTEYGRDLEDLGIELSTWR